MKLSQDQVEELRELLDRHDQDSECYLTGSCCSYLMIEHFRELLD